MPVQMQLAQHPRQIPESPTIRNAIKDSRRAEALHKLSCAFWVTGAETIQKAFVRLAILRHNTPPFSSQSSPVHAERRQPARIRASVDRMSRQVRKRHVHTGGTGLNPRPGTCASHAPDQSQHRRSRTVVRWRGRCTFHLEEKTLREAPPPVFFGFKGSNDRVAWITEPMGRCMFSHRVVTASNVATRHAYTKVSQRIPARMHSSQPTLKGLTSTTDHR